MPVRDDDSAVMEAPGPIARHPTQALPASEALLQTLYAHKVRFAHWKSNHHLAAALAGQTDLDLLVQRRDEERFRAAMRELRALQIQSQPWASYPGVEDWLVFDETSGGFLHLHIHYELVTGLRRVKHLVLPWKEEVLAGVRTDAASGWPIPAAEMELLNLLIRIWAKMPVLRRLAAPCIPSHIKEELRWLEAQVDLARLRDLAGRVGLKTAIGEIPGHEEDIITLARRLNEELKPQFRLAWPQALLAAAVLNFRLGLTRFWLRHMGPISYRKTLLAGGAMIAILGSDGSGKSTLSRDLDKWLRYKLDVHLIYMGSGDGRAGWVNGLRRALSAHWGNARAKIAGDRGISVRADLFPAKLYRLFDLSLMLRKLRLIRLGRRLAQRGSIILFDRYPQAQVNGISDGPRQQEGGGFAWAARIERKLFAEAARLGPDLVIKLSVDPETAHARKPDHDPQVIARKCAIVDALEFPLSQVVAIDASRPYAEVLKTAKAAIWHHLIGPQA